MIIWYRYLGLAMLRPLLILAVFLALCSPAFAARISVTVDLSQQTMTVRVGGETLYNWSVSTGRKGYRTPTGTYHPTRMHREYYSRKYDNAPMPYSIFFRGGYRHPRHQPCQRAGRRRLAWLRPAADRQRAHALQPRARARVGEHDDQDRASSGAPLS